MRFFSTSLDDGRGEGRGFKSQDTNLFGMVMQKRGRDRILKNSEH